MNKSHYKIKDFIDAIISTSRLLGYEIIKEDGFIHIHLEPNNPSKMITIKLDYQLGSTRLHTIVLEEEPSHLEADSTHDEKMNHLRYIMQSL